MRFAKQIKSVFLDLGIYRPLRMIYDKIKPSSNRRIAHDRRLFASLIKPGCLCFDIGANVGEKSHTLLSIGMNVVAFEPIPECVREIKARCSGFPQFIVCQKGLDGAIGRKTLYVGKGLAMSSFLDDWTNNVGPIEVETVTLDYAIQEFGRPYYCKIDVEGWELPVLRGLSTPIPLISFEYHLDRIESVRKCLAHLKDLTPDPKVNLTPAEKSEFVFDEFLDYPTFLQRFPHEFEDRQSDFRYGDIWVRTDSEDTPIL